MASDVIMEFVRQIQAIPKDAKEADILVISSGGDPIVAWHIVSLLREKFERLNVLLPYTAFSAATLLAMGADKIIMHPYANLGPVDPQITATTRKGDSPQSQVKFGSEDLANYLAFVREDVGLTDQEELKSPS